VNQATLPHAEAIAHLQQAEPVLDQIIVRYGPCTLQPRDLEPLVVLCRSIVYQQLSGKAAGTIMMRFLGLYDPDVLTPEALLRTTDDTLRGIGLSRQKIALGSARGQSDLGCALDVAFALVIAEHHITEEDVLAVALLFLSHDTTTGQRRIVGYRSTEIGGELFQRACGEKFGEHAR